MSLYVSSITVKFLFNYRKTHSKSLALNLRRDSGLELDSSDEIVRNLATLTDELNTFFTDQCPWIFGKIQEKNI